MISKKQIFSQSPTTEKEKKLKNHDQIIPNSDISTDSGELYRDENHAPRVEIFNSGNPLSEEIWQDCLTDAENLEEIALELARSNRS
jgi:hypothetical protein